MAFLDFLFGKSGRSEQIQRFTPQQQTSLDQILQQAMSGMQENQQYGFEPMAQQARTRFSQETIPSLAERFTSMGEGAQRSSAFQGSLGQAGAGLEENLAALGSQYGLQRQGQLQQMLGMGLQPQFENVYHESSPGFLQALAPSLGMALGGPVGSAASGGMSGLLQMFRQLRGGSGSQGNVAMAGG